MKDRVFIDSNIFLYAFCNKDLAKQNVAAKLILNGGAISVQVVNEVSSNMLKKLNFSDESVTEFVKSCYARYAVIGLELNIFIKAANLRKRYNVSYYDSLIIAAAISANANVLYSEDMQDSLKIDELQIINPFLR